MKFEKKKIAKKFFQIFFDKKKPFFTIPCSIDFLKYVYIKFTVYFKIINIKKAVINDSPHKPHFLNSIDFLHIFIFLFY